MARTPLSLPAITKGPTQPSPNYTPTRAGLVVEKLPSRCDKEADFYLPRPHATVRGCPYQFFNLFSYPLDGRRRFDARLPPDDLLQFGANQVPGLLCLQLAETSRVDARSPFLPVPDGLHQPRLLRELVIAVLRPEPTMLSLFEPDRLVAQSDERTYPWVLFGPLFDLPPEFPGLGVRREPGVTQQPEGVRPRVGVLILQSERKHEAEHLPVAFRRPPQADPVLRVAELALRHEQVVGQSSFGVWPQLTHHESAVGAVSLPLTDGVLQPSDRGF